MSFPSASSGTGGSGARSVEVEVHLTPRSSLGGGCDADWSAKCLSGAISVASLDVHSITTLPHVPQILPASQF